jgi:hypothetical protein
MDGAGWSALSRMSFSLFQNKERNEAVDSMGRAVHNLVKKDKSDTS